MLRLIFLLLAIASTAHAQTPRSFKINRNYGDVVAAVERLANEPRTTPFKMPNLPALISGKDVRIKTDLNPSTRTYTVDVELAMGVKGNLAKFDHRIKVTGYSTYYQVDTWVDIRWHDTGFGHRIVNCVARRAVPRAEKAFLCMEEARIKEYARQMGTPEVELAADSGIKWLVDAYRMVKRAKALRSK